MKRFLIGLGIFGVFVTGVSAIAYSTGLLVSEASSIEGIGDLKDAGSTLPLPSGDTVSNPLSTNTQSNGSQSAQLGTIKEAEKVTLQRFFNENFASLDQILTVGVPQLLIYFAGLVLLVMFIINAVKWLFAAGNDQGTTDAKQGLLFTGIGFVVVIMAYAIIRLAKQIFQ